MFSLRQLKRREDEETIFTFAPILPWGKGNGEDEGGAALLAIFPSPVLLAEEGRPNSPHAQALPSSKVRSYGISLDRQ